jgi:hypothetical protein
MSSIGQAMLEAASLIRTTQGSLQEKDVEEIVSNMTTGHSFAEASTDLGRFVEKDGERASNPHILCVYDMVLIPTDRLQMHNALNKAYILPAGEVDHQPRLLLLICQICR